MPSVEDIDLDRVRASLSSAILSDVMRERGMPDRHLSMGLRPVHEDMVVAGFAFPVAIRRVYDEPTNAFDGLLAAVEAICPDEVFVTPTQRSPDLAVWGEVLSTVCVARGAAGALTDGLVRDTRQIRQMGFPVISAGTLPGDGVGRHEIMEHRVPCGIDNVRIDPGDLIFGDLDGVVVVPHEKALAVVDAAFAKQAIEQTFFSAVSQGMDPREAFRKFGLL